MDFIRKPKTNMEKSYPYLNLEQLYPHSVTLYKTPPTENINLHEFETLALERLKILRIFEQANFRNYRFLSDEWREHIITEINREGLKDYLRLFQSGSAINEVDYQIRRKDYLSHFILRVAYCRSEDLQRWFVTREMEFFRLKFASLTINQIKEFLDINQLDYTPLTDKQKEEVKDGLYESTMGQSAGKVEYTDFYKVHFTQVLDLVKGRRCFLFGGSAYVSSSDFISIIAARYQNDLELSLIVAQRSLPETDNDERLVCVLRGLHTSYTGKDYSLEKGERIPLESLDQLSLKSYPLCMRHCHDIIRTTHQLKYGGRLQYTLFLKAIGLLLDDAIKFFRDEYTKIMDLERFEKNYIYNIRHAYGKEGSRINYSPHSCIKIIMESVGPQDTHGCPFKILDSVVLKARLVNYGISSVHVQDVVGFAAKGHYQIACGRYFEVIHDLKMEQGINHPNQYFELSQNLMGIQEAKSNVNTASKSVPTVVKSKEANNSLLQSDDELWNILETQERQTLHNQPAENTDEWGGEFDVSQVTDIGM